MATFYAAMNGRHGYPKYPMNGYHWYRWYSLIFTILNEIFSAEKSPFHSFLKFPNYEVLNRIFLTEKSPFYSFWSFQTTEIYNEPKYLISNQIFLPEKSYIHRICFILHRLFSYIKPNDGYSLYSVQISNITSRIIILHRENGRVEFFDDYC